MSVQLWRSLQLSDHPSDHPDFQVVCECRYPNARIPAYLEKADLPGTNGFDPLGLGRKPENLAWYHEAEKTNGRWAMAAVAGILFVELTKGDNWVNAGAEVGNA